MKFLVCGNVYVSAGVDTDDFDEARDEVECMDIEELLKNIDGFEVTYIQNTETGESVCY